MSSHAERIQAILAREREAHTRQGQLVRASVLALPPRVTAVAQAGARPRPISSR